MSPDAIDSATLDDSRTGSNHFAIICVLGPPGAGKGTICKHLAGTHNLAHYSIGDNLRNWMQQNRDSSLAAQIQDKLDNQGFLLSEDLNPFIRSAIGDALHRDDSKPIGILLDGFPRCIEQLNSFDTWPFQDELTLDPSVSKPDVVLSVQVSQENAQARYLARGRGNSNKENFKRRFDEYLAETVEVETEFRQRGKIIDLDINGTKEEALKAISRTLESSILWQKTILKRPTAVAQP